MKMIRIQEWFKQLLRTAASYFMYDDKEWQHSAISHIVITHNVQYKQLYEWFDNFKQDKNLTKSYIKPFGQEYVLLLVRTERGIFIGTSTDLHDDDGSSRYKDYWLEHILDIDDVLMYAYEQNYYGLPQFWHATIDNITSLITEQNVKLYYDRTKLQKGEHHYWH